MGARVGNYPAGIAQRWSIELRIAAGSIKSKLRHRRYGAAPEAPVRRPLFGRRLAFAFPTASAFCPKPAAFAIVERRSL
jgi:hypothetical protein